MILVIGGAYQGKLEYAKKLVKERSGDCDGAVQAADGACIPLQELWRYPVVNHFQECVRRLANEGGSAEPFVEQLLERNPDVVIVMNEVGSGIVPVRAEDRAYREAVGAAGCFLAGKAQQVWRVICGIGTRIK